MRHSKQLRKINDFFSSRKIISYLDGFRFFVSAVTQNFASSSNVVVDVGVVIDVTVSVGVGVGVRTTTTATKF